MDNITTIRELEIRTHRCRQDCDSACKNIVNGQCSCIDALSLKALKEVEAKKNFYFLRDISDNLVDAVITSTTSTAKDITESINKVKENDDYDWHNIIDSLPADCEIYDRWSNNIQNIYY